jgi:hypothetical protein
MPSTTAFGRLTSMLRAMSYTPGVSSRFLPRASWELMACTESPGLATKKSLSGMVRPAVRSVDHEVPLELCCAAGTRTLYRPCSSTNRYGFSRLTGVAASVVYGGFGKVASLGAPTTPEKTWFHTPLDQLLTVLLRVSHCCCEPLMTSGMSESAMKPPLAYCGPAVQ